MAAVPATWRRSRALLLRLLQLAAAAWLAGLPLLPLTIDLPAQCALPGC